MRFLAKGAVLYAIQEERDSTDASAIDLLAVKSFDNLKVVAFSDYGAKIGDIPQRATIYLVAWIGVAPDSWYSYDSSRFQLAHATGEGSVRVAYPVTGILAFIGRNSVLVVALTPAELLLCVYLFVFVYQMLAKPRDAQIGSGDQGSEV